jgi:hypothetical protein
MRAAIVLSSLLLLAACNADPRGSSANGPGGTALPSPAIVGTVTKVTPVVPAGETQGSVLIEEKPDQPNGGNKIVFTVKNTSDLFRRSGGADQRISFGELRVGQSVQAWAVGPIAESFPEQATAATILVLSGP